LLPFVEVPPLPDASPRPILFSLCVLPAAGFRLCSFILLVDFELSGNHPSQLIKLLNNKFQTPILKGNGIWNSRFSKNLR
jgi:hypothetical protein